MLPEADLSNPNAQELLLSPRSARVLATAIFVASFGEEYSLVYHQEVDCLHKVHSTPAEGAERWVVRAENCQVPVVDDPSTTEDDGRFMTFNGEFEAEWSDGYVRVVSSGWSETPSWPHESCGGETSLTFAGRIELTEQTLELDLLMGGHGEETFGDAGECRTVEERAIRYQTTTTQGDQVGIAGHGEIGTRSLGKSRVESSGEPTEDTCESEWDSGITRATAGGRTLEVRYDGATECTDPPSAPLFLDGEPAGTTKYACAIALGSNEGAPSYIFGLVAFAVLARRRRFRSARPGSIAFDNKTRR